jgi:hypothetical protein
MRHSLRQIERLHEEDCHRVSLDHCVGTVIPATASARGRIHKHLLDVVRAKGADRNIGEDTRCHGRDESNSMFGADKEDRHLRAIQIGWDIIFTWDCGISKIFIIQPKACAFIDRGPIRGLKPRCVTFWQTKDSR